MSLVFIGQRNYINQTGFVDLPYLVNNRDIVIDIESNQKKQTWYKSGDLLQVVKLELLNCEVADSYTYMTFNPILVRFPLADGINYFIRFKPVPWLTNFNIKLYKWIGS